MSETTQESEARSSGPIVTRPATIDVGRLDLLDPDFPDEQALAMVEKRALFREKLIKLAIRQTSPSQYVIHRDETGKRESVYPMGAAADAMFGLLGLTWAVAIPAAVDEKGNVLEWRRGDEKWKGEVKAEGENGERRYYRVRSALWSKDACVALCEGKRLIGSGYSKDEATTEQNAFENLKSRACREVLGLKGRDRAWYDGQGLNLSTATIAEFQDRKGSENPDEAMVKWGPAVKKNDGKPIKVADLSDEDLRWYTERQEKDCADPTKAKFHPERMLKALQAEAERRAAKPTVSAEDEARFEELMTKLREEVTAAQVKPEKAEEFLKSVTTIAQAEKGIEYYRKKREEKAKKNAAPEPGSEG